jgi:RNase P subunit RPR2
MTLDPLQIKTFAVNNRTQIIHGLKFKTMHCLKCHGIIADGIMDGTVRSIAQGVHPVRILCRNCKTENFICH